MPKRYIFKLIYPSMIVRARWLNPKKRKIRFHVQINQFYKIKVPQFSITTI